MAQVVKYNKSITRMTAPDCGHTSDIAVLNYTANHTPTAGKRKNHAGKLAIWETWMAESGVWPQILLNLHQHYGRVWAGAYNGKVSTVDPLAISVRPHTSTHNHNTNAESPSAWSLNKGALSRSVRKAPYRHGTWNPSVSAQCTADQGSKTHAKMQDPLDKANKPEKWGYCHSQTAPCWAASMDTWAVGPPLCIAADNMDASSAVMSSLPQIRVQREWPTGCLAHRILGQGVRKDNPKAVQDSTISK